MPVLLFAFAVSVVTGIAFGVAPAWLTSHADPVEALRGVNRSTRDSGSFPRKALVVIQAALSLALLSSAGLLTRSLSNLQHQNYGFARDGRWIVRFDPKLAGYKLEQLEALYREIHDRLIQIPGVVNMSSSLYTPMSGGQWNEYVYMQGQPPPGPDDDISAAWVRVGPHYFETTGSRILRGRPLTEQDTAASRHVAVINEAFARRFFKNQNPIGKHFGKGTLKYAGDYEIVGVAADARYWSWDLNRPVRPMFFVPSQQNTQYAESNNISAEVRSHYFRIVELQVAARLPSLEAQIRRAFAGINPDLTVISVQSVDDMVNENFSRQELIARLTSLFGLLALVLASIGVYGVTAYAVGRRTAEIGIRMAVGADRSSVLALVLRAALALIAAGLALGLVVTFAMSRFLGNQLYRIATSDPVVLTESIGVLVLSAIAAAYIPARRAASIAPMDALRTE
jgi:predicted permease